MRVSSRNIIDNVISQRPNSQEAKDLSAWLDEVEDATWLGDGDLMATYPSAQKLQSSLWRFPMISSPVSVEALVGYHNAGQVIIQGVA